MRTERTEGGTVGLGPDEAREGLDVFGGRIAVEADGAATRGAYALLQMSAPGDGAPPREAFPPAHVHHREEEAWFILEGTFAFQIGDRTFEAGAGSFVLVPRGTVHTYWAIGPQSHHRLTIFSPAGTEGYFREFAQLLRQYQTAPPDELRALAGRYHLEFV